MPITQNQYNIANQLNFNKKIRQNFKIETASHMANHKCLKAYFTGFFFFFFSGTIHPVH